MKVTIGFGLANTLELTHGTPIYTYREDGQKHLVITVDDDGGLQIRSVGNANGLAVYPRAANDIKVREMW